MTNQKTVVVLCGTAGVGKDTAGNMLVELVGGVRMAYADPLKDAVEALVGIPKSILYGTRDVKESFIAYGKTARYWLQWLGTEVGRQQIHNDLWVHRFADRVMNSPEWLVVCSDGRFKNEVETLRERLAGKANVYSVRVSNPRVTVDLTHQSEREIYELPDSYFDRILVNDGSPQLLWERVAALAHSFGMTTKSIGYTGLL